MISQLIENAEERELAIAEANAAAEAEEAAEAARLAEAEAAEEQEVASGKREVKIKPRALRDINEFGYWGEDE